MATDVPVLGAGFLSTQPPPPWSNEPLTLAGRMQSKRCMCGLRNPQGRISILIEEKWIRVGTLGTVGLRMCQIIPSYQPLKVPTVT